MCEWPVYTARIANQRIIATPGRLLHLIVEMNYDMRTVETVIYDEADRYV